MEQGQIGLIVFILVSLLSAIIFHYKKDSFWISSVLASIVAAIIFQIAGFFVLGYLDPFFLIAFAATLVLSFVISVVVGIPFAILRKKRKAER